MKVFKYIGIAFLFGLIIQSCSNTKFLAEDEKLYTYTWFSEKGIGKVNNLPLKAYELYLVGIVKTNRRAVMLPRTNLTIFNYMKPSGTWGPRHYIHRVFGKPPVLLEDVNPEFRVRVMEQRLADMGLFDSDITLDLKIYGRNDKKARAKYQVLFRPAYTYRNLEFTRKNTPLDSLIGQSMAGTIIRTGNDYWLKELESERDRISTVLRNQGYYFFNPGYLFFHADTSAGSRQVDLRLMTKDEIPAKVFNKYSLRNINVQVKSNRDAVRKFIPVDSARVNHVNYLAFADYYRPDVITRHLSLDSGNIYNSGDHENTLRYMQGMEAFRSVNVLFSEVDSSSRQLDATIELVPVKPLQTNLELNFASKSNDFLGPAAIGSISHMNIFKGAEQLIFQLDGGFEWQKRSKRKEYELGLNSYELGAQLKLVIPRFLVPFRLNKQSERYVPKTYMSLGFRKLKRVKYYNMDMSQARFGYSWRTSPEREFKLEPISIDYVRLTQTSDEFDEFLASYPQVAKSFEQQFIIGSTMSYTYTSNPKWKKFNKFYYNGTLDLSGNLLNAVYTVTGVKEPNSGETGSLFGVPYSQYTKLTNDLRYYIYINEKNQVASRLVAGIGIPYNNSSVMPYVKQYFAGGSQDIRAFYARTLGPGSYHPPDSVANSTFLDQSGEIKLMGNIEYRFPITYMTNGAVFMDAGNVWLLNDDPSRPGGKFEFNKFLDDIALGFGAGIRVDITYLVFRLDAAVPLRKPFLEENKWIFNNADWIWKDYIFSLAVGYPF
ncbi:MAG: BamA/TamA family outer membrane protein [Bacteroidales bacterium]|nr:BamA/TamA family outer membrane protein [Bacteroidales bacterium]